MTLSIFSPPLPKSTQTTHDIRHWGNLQGSSTALAIANGAKQANGPVLLITADSPSAIKLEKELAFFIDDNSLDVQLFPDWETLPYDNFSPHQDIVSQRLEALYQLTQHERRIFIVPINTLMMRMAPIDYIGQYLLLLKVNQTLNIDTFRTGLERAGYLHVNQVMSHSEFSIRGSIIDLYPMGSEHPFRIDLFDDEIDTIRHFDPETQRSGDKVNEIKLLPAREFPTDKEAISLFRQQYLAKFDANNSKGSVFNQVSKGLMPGGIEYYLPLFFNHTASIFDYLHPDSLVMAHGDLQHAHKQHWDDISHRYDQLRYNIERPLLDPAELYLRHEEMFAALKPWSRVQIQTKPVAKKAGHHNFNTHTLDNIALQPQAKLPWASMQKQVKTWIQNKTRVLFSAESAGRRESLLEILTKANIKPASHTSLQNFLQSKDSIGITVGPAEFSFFIDETTPVAFITETELLGHKISHRRKRDHKRATDESAIIRNLAELAIGQPVVHFDHGVGRYLGLQTLDAGGITTEYLNIEYAKQAKLYVPVASLHLISRYSGGDIEHAPLHHLGNDTWAKAKKKAAEKVRDVAAQLLDVYARRAAKPGYAFKIAWDEYQTFSDSFPYEETLDQQKAINAVIQDMGSSNAMDRLVCGDVGFGKTEVAMRAAFIAANQGKQVAILVPTTLLAHQHFENFKERFVQCPFKIEVLSRFVSAKDAKRIIADIEGGQVDIVVGTHTLLQEKMKFNDLGLVIIDEEHRFGVRQKEKFKALRSDVDILTLTATPIPRTLNMALSGMRDLSIIATPPAKRLPIKTFVQQRSDEVIREAIMREILRGGQVYFLHNEVDTIEKTALEIKEIVPEARISIGHGQMRERELETVMSDFYHQRSNVLLCTTIIETGIDVPSANTIVMDRADHLGLAQLHQLRGRVGRSHHQAYAYLMTPHPKRLTKDAAKRLEAISSLENLGAGFALATHDLEIRGAGELLGDGQSGQISSVGFTLYMDMLDQAVEALKSGKEPSDQAALSEQTEIDLRIPALIPDDYIHDINTRLSLYKKLAGCMDQAAINEFQIELIDRFGLPPVSTKNMIALQSLKVKAKHIGIRKAEGTNKGGFIEFSENAEIDPGFIIQLIQSQPRIYKLDGPQKLKFIVPTESAADRLSLFNDMLEQLGQNLRAA